jgi:capsular exopolysaccharide synthesis family protein
MNLQFASDGDSVKTLMITSATPNEGKSTIAVMLASALAEEGKRVLLCDMDFRNPSLGKYLGTRNRLDIVDVLKGNAKIEKIITESSIKGLFVVDSYHKRVLLPNVVQSPQYKEFITTVSHHFDYVIFDTPPIGLFIDSAILASIADRTLLVVASGCVERVLDKEVVDQLQKANASIIGVALNFVDARNSHYGNPYRNYRKYRSDRPYDENDSDIPDGMRA